MFWIPEVITCMTRVCHRQQEYEVDECVMVDYSHGCDVCGDVPCPTIVIPGPLTSCTTFSCVDRESTCKPDVIGVSFLGGE